jgi:membrane dipeptidase
MGRRTRGPEAKQKALHPDRPDLVKAAMGDWMKANPKPAATLSDVADHIDHIKKRIGVDHIGLGSDYDGGSVGIVGMPDASSYPRCSSNWPSADTPRRTSRRSPAGTCCAC